jgi:thiamine monophosphate synthase
MAYATREQLAETVPGLSAERADLALQAASDYVDSVCFGTAEPAQHFADPAPARVTEATLVAAARFARLPEAPYGTVGGIGEMPIYAKGSIPDVDKLLAGYRQSFGIA